MFPSIVTHVIHFAACTLSVVITLSTIILNLLTLLTFRRTPRLRNNIFLYLVMILCMVEAGTRIFCYPSLTVHMIYELEIPNCWMKYLQSKLFKLSSIFSLSLVSAISIERYFGVMHPLIHRTKITKKKLTLLLVLIWSICTFPFATAILTNKPFNFIITSTLLLLILLTMYAYIRIGCAVIQSNVQCEEVLNANVGHE